MTVNIQSLMDELEKSKVSLRRLYVDTIKDFLKEIKIYRILLVISMFLNVILTVIMLIL